MKYLNGSKDLVLTLSANQLNILKWYDNTAFAVHANFKSHSGTSKKLNTKSSMTSELVGTDHAMTMMLWTKLFVERQSYKIHENILYQESDFVREEWEEKYRQAITCIGRSLTIAGLCVPLAKSYSSSPSFLSVTQKIITLTQQ